MNRQIITIVSVLALLVLVFVIYFYVVKIGDKPVKPITAVPDNAVFIFETKQPGSRLNELRNLPFFEQMNGNEHVRRLFRSLHDLDSLLLKSPQAADWLDNGEMAFSFHVFANDAGGFFLALQTGKQSDPERSLGWIQEAFPGRFQQTKRKFISFTIYDYVDFKGNLSFSVAFHNKLLLFSFDGSLVELSLLKLQKQAAFDKSLEKLTFVTAASDFNMYVNYSNLPVFLNSYVEDKQVFDFMKSFAGITAYNISMKKNAVLFRGASVTNDSIFQFMDVMSGQAPVQNTIRAVIPSNAHFYLTIAHSNYDRFYSDMKEFLLSRNLFMQYNRDMDSLESYYQVSIAEKFISRIADQAALINLDIPGIDFDSSFAFILKVSDAQGMGALLDDYHKAWLKKNAADSNAALSGDPVRPCIFGDVLKFFYGPALDGKKLDWYARSEDYFIFAQKKETLTDYLEHRKNSQLLGLSEEFKEAVSEFPSQDNIEVFVSTEHAMKAALHFADLRFLSTLNQNIGYFRKARYVLLQYTAGADKTFLSNAGIFFNLDQHDHSELVWSIELDTTLAIEPAIVQNTATGENCIFVQDVMNKIYMVDKEGKIRWKQQLNDRIISPVSVVDAFGNGSAQFLFNSAKQVYLFDADGKQLQGFPLWIPTGTNFPLHLLEDGPANMKFFLTGRQFKVTGYNLQGRLLPSWNPKAVWPNIVSPMNSFQFGTEHLIYGLNEKGKLDFFTLGGKPYQRIRFDSSLFVCEATHRAADTGHVRFYLLDTSYNLHITDVFTTAPSKTVKYPLNAFRHFSLTANTSIGNETFVLKNETEYAVMDASGKLIANKLNRDSSITNLRFVFLLNQQKVVYLDSRSQQIYVEDPAGVPYPPFPQNGAYSFTFGNLYQDVDTYLVTGYGDKKLLLYRVK
jgi:hypothetical protein